MRDGPGGEGRQCWFGEQDIPLQRSTGLAVDEHDAVFVSSSDVSGVLRWRADGQGWTRIDEGLGDYHFVRIVRDASNDLWFLPHARSGRRAGSIFRRWRRNAEPEFAEVELPDEIGEVRDLARTGEDYGLATDVGVVTGQQEGACSYRFMIGKRFGAKLPATITFRYAARPDVAFWVVYDYNRSHITCL